MPRKLMLDEAILDSPSLAACSTDAALHWHRLAIATADPFGSFKISLPVILATAYPDRARWAGVTEAKIDAWFTEYGTAGMLVAWVAGGRLYGNWTGYRNYNRIDARYSVKIPIPPQGVAPYGSAEMRRDAEKCGEIPPLRIMSVSCECECESECTCTHSPGDSPSQDMDGLVAQLTGLFTRHRAGVHYPMLPGDYEALETLWRDMTRKHGAEDVRDTILDAAQAYLSATKAKSPSVRGMICGGKEGGGGFDYWWQQAEEAVK